MEEQKNFKEFINDIKKVSTKKKFKISNSYGVFDANKYFMLIVKVFRFHSFVWAPSITIAASKDKTIEKFFYKLKCPQEIPVFTFFSKCECQKINKQDIIFQQLATRVLNF